MRNFKFFKKTPVKVISSILLFLIFAGIISWAVSYPFDKIYSNSNERDIVFLGASETEWGINPKVIDEKTGHNSYLLATSGCTLEGRYEMLKYALEQKSLKTVVIDVAYFALRKDMTDFEMDKRVLYYSRISGFKNQFAEARSNFSFMDDEYDQLYSEKIFEGMNAWKKYLSGNYCEFSSYKGYDPQGVTSQLLSKDEAKNTFKKEKLNTAFREENIDIVKKIVALCKENDAKAIIITLPLSEKYLWQNDGLDVFHDQMLEISKDCDVDYYDFNLLKDRSSILSDETSYRDEEHLCDEGVTIFSGILSDVLNAEFAGDNSPYEFYDSYDEALKNSVYAE